VQPDIKTPSTYRVLQLQEISEHGQTLEELESVQLAQN